jgi:hypothetical protein
MAQDMVDTVQKAGKYSDLVAQAYADHPEVKKQADKLAVLDDQISHIDDEQSKVYEEYKTKYPGIPEAELMLMVNRASYGMTQTRNGLVREATLLNAQYKDAKDMMMTGIDYDIKQQEAETQRNFEVKKLLYGTEVDKEKSIADYAEAEKQIETKYGHDKTLADELRTTNLQEFITKL